MNVKIGSTLLMLAGVVPFPLIAQDWPMLGGAPQRNMASAMTNLPESWDIKSGKNIKWKALIGSTSYGNLTRRFKMGRRGSSGCKFLPNSAGSTNRSRRRINRAVNNR